VSLLPAVGGEEASAVVLQDASAAVGASRWWRAAALHHPRPVYCRFFWESMRTAVGWSRRIGPAKRRLTGFLSAVEVMSTERQTGYIMPDERMNYRGGSWLRGGRQ
jgi:hypothetical protein